MRALSGEAAALTEQARGLSGEGSLRGHPVPGWQSVRSREGVQGHKQTEVTVTQRPCNGKEPGKCEELTKVQAVWSLERRRERERPDACEVMAERCRAEARL